MNDGSTLQLQHRDELVQNYPPAQNQYGRSHWPILQVAVLHDARSGLALLPAWGPMYGSRAVSEQELAEHLLDQLPPEAVLLGDRNFGIFHTAYAAQQVAQDAARQAMSHGMREIEVRVKGPGSGRESAIRALQAIGGPAAFLATAPEDPRLN